MKKLLILFTGVITLALTLVSFMPDGPFEGTIDFEKKTGSTTIKYKYLIKGDKIRVEDYGTDGTLQGVMLVNTSTGKVFNLSPDRKLYSAVPKKEPNMNIEVVVKTGGKKEIAGVSCTEYNVTCEAEQRITTFYVGGSHFNFFVPFLKTLHRKDKLSVYFQKLNGIDGMFPFMGVEKKLDGTVLTTLKVNSYKRESIADDLFEIPKDYKEFKK
ncbi:MAG TPA: DUF4412 domain-containing protein [Flavobacteriales bacterium]|nr:DUF4412 domain-containing protein [Flavobacteriales bacterium]